MKHLKNFVVALALAFLAGCAGYTPKRTGYFQPDSLGIMRPLGEVRSSGDPETIRSQGEFLGAATGAELAKDTSLSEVGRLTALAINKGAETTRAFARVLHETGVSTTNAIPSSPATTSAPVFTKVQTQLLEAGFVWDRDRGCWFAPPSLDPAKQSPLNEAEAVLIYKYKDASDQGPARALIDSIKGKYH